MRKDSPLYMLVADDEEVLRAGISSLPWQAHGISLLPVAKNGIEAAEIAARYPVDILLTDIQMPGKSGLELAEEVQKMYPHVQILFLSGYSEFSYAQKAITLGARNYILKPSTPNDILASVEETKRMVLARRGEQEASHCLQLELDNATRMLQVQNKPGEDTSKDEGNIEKILAYIADHYGESLSLSELAERFHFSSVYLSRFIKKKTGHTFTELVTNIRMYHAAHLLRETGKKNGEIAEQVGIHDERYFGQVFQKTFGISPAEYRKSKQHALNLNQLLFGEIIEKIT